MPDMDEIKEKGLLSSPEKPMTEKDAIAALKEIQIGANGFIAHATEVKTLEAQYRALSRKSDELEVAAQNMQAPKGVLGKIQELVAARFSKEQAELKRNRDEMTDLRRQIHEKSAQIYRGIVACENIGHVFVQGNRDYRIAETISMSLLALSNAAGEYLKAVENAQLKVRGAIEAGAEGGGGDIVLKIPEGDQTIPASTGYYKAAAEAIQAVKLNAKFFERAVDAYKPDAVKSSGWDVTVAIDSESFMKVNLLTHAYFLDVYKQDVFEDLQAQLLGLKEALEQVLEHIARDSFKLTGEKNKYDRKTLKDLCRKGHLYFFEEDERDFYEERADPKWTGGKQQRIVERESDPHTEK